MTALRRKRGAPDPDAASIVGAARDIDVLESLGWAGFLATSQVEHLHFPSRRTAQRRLRALLDHGLVRAHTQGEALQKESVFTLTPLGAEQLIEQRILEPATVKLAHAPRLGKLAHLLLTRDAFVTFVLAEKAALFTLREFRFEEDLGKDASLRAAGLLPDALVDVAFPGLEERVALEVDCGTETTTTLTKKFTAYRTVFAAPGSALGATRTMLHVVALTEARATTIRRIVADVGLTGRTLVALRDALPQELRARYSREPYVHPVRAGRTAPRAREPVFRAVATPSAAAFRPLQSERPIVRPAGARTGA
ncbi:MAG: replication-relaxation family protein [Polyangiaceae bacterium]